MTIPKVCALPAEASGTATITLDGLGNTIDDAEFFPDLPGLVNGVADRLTRLMTLDKRLISALHKACTCTLMPPSLYGCLVKLRSASSNATAWAPAAWRRKHCTATWSSHLACDNCSFCGWLMSHLAQWTPKVPAGCRA